MSKELTDEQIQQVTIVEILPTKIWIENGMCGERIVVVQHQGMPPFDYAVFNYCYGYTSNSTTWDAAIRVAKSIGATEPIETKNRELRFQKPDEIRQQIALLEQELVWTEQQNAEGETP